MNHCCVSFLTHGLEVGKRLLGQRARAPVILWDVTKWFPIRACALCNLSPGEARRLCPGHGALPSTRLPGFPRPGGCFILRGCGDPPPPWTASPPSASGRHRLLPAEARGRCFPWIANPVPPRLPPQYLAWLPIDGASGGPAPPGSPASFQPHTFCPPQPPNSWPPSPGPPCLCSPFPFSWG